MKVPTPIQPLMLPLLVIVLYLLSPAALYSQCVMACNNGVEVALDDNCQAEVLPDMLLEGSNSTNCTGPYSVLIQDANGATIPSSPFVNASHIGLTLTVMVTDQPSGNSCWGTIMVTDGLAPAITCDTISLPCSFDITPIDGPPGSGLLPVMVMPQQAIGPAAADTTRIGLLASLPANAVVSDVNLSLNLNHSNSDHLDVYLLSPSGLEVELATDVCGNNSNWSNLSFDDEALIAVNAACGGNPALSGSVQPEGSLSDFDGRPASGLWQLVIIDDTNGGAGLLSNASLQVSYEQLAAYRPATMDACGPSNLSFIDAVTPGLCSDTFTQIIRRTWTATDASNNSRSCTQLIIREREGIDDLRIPASYDGILQAALECEDRQRDPAGQILPNIGWNALPNGHPSPYDEYYPAPNNDIVKWYGTGAPIGGCGDFQSTFTDTRIDQCTPGSSACFKIVRIWLITDWCTGQVYNRTQVIKIADHEGPMISGISNASIGTNPWDCSADWSVPPPVLSDNCDALSGLSYSVSSSGGTVSQNANGSYQISGLSPGTYTVTYTASDCCGNSRDNSIQLTVADNTPPSVVCDQHTQAALNIDGTTTVPASTFDDGSHDNCGPVFLKVIRMTELLGSDNGSIINQGGACLGLNGDDDNSRLGRQIYFDDYARFCCEDLNSNIQVVLRVFDVDPGSGPVAPARMAPGGDLAGHFNQCMAFIELVDKLPPRISCPADVTLECTQDYTDLNLTGQATATDNCQLDTLFYTDVTDLNMCNAGTVVRTWMAMDAQGLMAVCTQNITLTDPTTPTFFFPPDINVSCGESDDPSNTGEPYGVDSDCAFIASTYTDLVFWFQDSCLRKVLREWKIVDWCSGASQTDLQVIKEYDDLPPVFSIQPRDTTVDCNAVPPPANITLTDNCDPTPDLVFTESRTDGNCADNYQLLRRWVATDRCGNADSIFQIISVQDTLAPSISQTPADTLVNCDAIPPAASPLATDNCDPMPGLDFREERMDGNCADNYSLRRIWTATDRCGNQDSSIQIIMVQDSSAPVITGIPAGMIVDCDQVPMPVPGSATDNCDPMPQLDFTETRINGSCQDRYTLRRVWTATDRCGNQDSSIQIISVQDMTPPVIEAAPADTTVDCDAIPAASNLMASDNCDPAPSVAFRESRSDGNCADNYSLRRVWIASDRCGNQDSMIQIITVQDTVAPTLLNIPADTTVACMPGALDNNVMASDNCDANVNIRLIINNPGGVCDGNNQIIRTWIAIDNCGNMDTAQQVITLIDTIPPVINNVPNDTLIDCSSSLPPASPIAMDDCTSTTIMMTQREEAGDCIDERTVIRIWTAMDECGNIARDSQIVMFIDSLPPVWDNFPADTTVRCDNVPNPLRDISASDNCDNAVDITFFADTINRVCENSFTIRRTWIAEDNCMNQARDTQLIMVIDTIAPIFNGIPNDTTLACNALATMPNVSATDECDVMVDINFMVDTLDRVCENTFTIRRIWIAEDNCGNSSRDSQLVMVIDTIAPMLVGVPADTMVACDNIPATPQIGSDITANDNCDALVDITFSSDTINRDPNCPDELTIVRRWTAEDNCGNMSQDSQLVMVIDTLAPMILGMPVDTIVDCNAVPPAANLLASDNCDPMPSVSFRESRSDGNCADNYSLRRVWIASDRCGNQDSVVQLIMVQDTIAPMLMNIPADTTVECMPDVLSNNVTATDNCDTGVDIRMSTNTPGGACDVNNQLIRTWIATDNCGNMDTAQQVITLIDTIPPVINNVPNDTLIDCSSPLPPADPVAMDACTSSSIMMTQREVDGDCVDERTVIRIWTAIDECGNMARDSQIVMFIDTLPPVWDNFPADTTVRCDNVPNPLRDISASDNCDTEVDIIFLADTINRVCENSFTIRRTWIAGDNCMNQARDTQIITVIDTIAPILNGVPNDTTLLCEDLAAMPNISATDECDAMVDISLMVDTLSRVCDNTFTIRRIWIAEDNCGNSSRDSQLVNVIDTIAPILMGVPADTTLLCDNISATPQIGSDITAIDNCDTLVNITFSSDTINRDPVCPHERTIVRRWTAEDNCGNISRDSQLLMIIDTIPPVLLGIPQDTIVSCDSIPDSPLVDNVTVTDNCDLDSQISFRTDTMPGSCPGEFTIFRIWRATDKCSNIVLDTQRIEVVDTIAPVLSGIPRDTMLDCRLVTNPPEIGRKINATDNCDTLVMIEFMETRDEACAHTYVLTRTWTATDDCGNQQVATQQISVIDTTAPVFVDLRPDVPPYIIVKDSFIVTQDSCDILIPIIATAMDNCDDGFIITNDSDYAFDNNSGDATGDYPIGEHIITFTATDSCDNSSTAQALVRIIDAVGPATSCMPLVVTLSPITGTFTIYPEDVATAFDACSPEATIAFQGPNPDSIVLTCADLPRRLVMVESFDSIMLPGGCDALVTILLPPSNPNLCDSLSPLSGIVSGQLLTDEGNYLPEVEVNAEGGMSASEMTENSGFFTFQQLPLNQSYEIAPHDNANPLQGVNSFDLVLISRHILGIDALTSPYKMIAADVNKSGSITTTDMVELRKLILYINTEFENNTSWRFLPADFSFADPANPFVSPFPEFYKIDKLEGSMINIDFTGIKTGDLNGSAGFTNGNQSEDRNTRPRLKVHSSDQLLQAGESYQVDFRAEAFADLAGLQFTLNFDPELLEFVKVESDQPAMPMQAQHFGTQLSKQGLLTAAWGEYPGKVVAANDQLFSLHFRAKASGLLSQALHLSSDRTPIAVFDSEGQDYNLDLQFDQDLLSEVQQETQLFQNRPNPFTQETLIPFFLAEAATVQLSVFDVSGRLIKQINQQYPAGYHEVKLSSTALPGQAIYYYQLQTDRFAATRKMVFTKAK